MGDSALIEQDGALIAPAWIGPASLLVPKQGLSYRFGVFILTADNLAFAVDEQVAVEERRADVQVKWPRNLWGAGFHMAAPTSHHAICFGAPFWNVPRPSQYSIAESAATLAAIPALGFTAGQDWLPEGAIVSHLLNGMPSLYFTWQGRPVAARVRAALEG